MADLIASDIRNVTAFFQKLAIGNPFLRQLPQIPVHIQT